jgi:hypothetical protein
MIANPTRFYASKTLAIRGASIVVSWSRFIGQFGSVAKVYSDV